jgi:AcrR family transcriptional regulator
MVRASVNQPLMIGAKADIADATIRVIARDGFDVVSVRTVAKEAGLAAGTVQYHYPLRDDLLVGALVRNGQRQLMRITNQPKDQRVAERLIRSLSELLPLDDDRRDEAALWVAMSSAASTRPSLTAQYLAELDVMRSMVRQALAVADHEGTLRNGISPDEGAYIITALTNGLTIDGLNAPKEDRPRIQRALADGVRFILNEPVRPV